MNQGDTPLIISPRKASSLMETRQLSSLEPTLEPIDMSAVSMHSLLTNGDSCVKAQFFCDFC